MTEHEKTVIVDATQDKELEKYLYRCLAPMPFRKYWRRQEYLEAATPKGFHKLLLVFNNDIVGQIEYVPAEASGYPIKGDNTIVIHCIWVLRRAKGHNFGKLLLQAMIKNSENVAGFSTIALENHWSPWLRRDQMEKLGFKPIDSVEVCHKTKHVEECFRIYLMWMPRKQDAKPPTLDKTKILDGIRFCTAHPLYHPERIREKQILENCQRT